MGDRKMSKKQKTTTTTTTTNESVVTEKSSGKAGDDRTFWSSPGSTSVLELQTGCFRLIQGSAYRVYKEKYAAHHETHKTVKSLPYMFPKFVEFVDKFVHFYKSLGILDSSCNEFLDDLAKSINDEYANLKNRMDKWKELEKEGKITDDMAKEHEVMMA